MAITTMYHSVFPILIIHINEYMSSGMLMYHIAKNPQIGFILPGENPSGTYLTYLTEHTVVCSILYVMIY